LTWKSPDFPKLPKAGGVKSWDMAVEERGEDCRRTKGGGGGGAAGGRVGAINGSGW